jgi:hypothetical protein
MGAFVTQMDSMGVQMESIGVRMESTVTQMKYMGSKWELR